MIAADVGVLFPALWQVVKPLAKRPTTFEPTFGWVFAGTLLETFAWYMNGVSEESIVIKKPEIFLQGRIVNTFPLKVMPAAAATEKGRRTPRTNEKRKLIVAGNEAFRESFTDIDTYYLIF